VDFFFTRKIIVIFFFLSGTNTYFSAIFRDKISHKRHKVQLLVSPSHLTSSNVASLDTKYEKQSLDLYEMFSAVLFFYLRVIILRDK
jgi:hypothetical protein